MAKTITLSLLFMFIGFVLGRIGHMIGGTSTSPHHWIYGLIIMIIGFFLHKFHLKIGIFVFFLGSGIFTSDFKDFLNLQFYSADTVSKFVFWNID